MERKSRARSAAVLLLLVFSLFGVTACGRGEKGGMTGSFPVKLAAEGSYLIMASQDASKDYIDALTVAQDLHRNALTETFTPEDISSAESILTRHKPRYAMVFLKPEELDVNFAWAWLTMIAELDEDPFADVRTGFITGESPEKVLLFLTRIREAVEGRLKLPLQAVDNLGPNTMMGKTGFQKQKGSFMIPVLTGQFPVYTISHGIQGFSKERLLSMDGSGIVHFGGHGYPDRIVDCLNGPYARQLKLSPCAVFNGACYTGVTGKWFELFNASGKVKEHSVDPGTSFAFGILGNSAVAYCAALHPDHGIPVYQEMEYLCYSGASLGDMMKYTYDGVVIGAGGKLPRFERLKGGMPSPRWAPADIMLKGTASRVLFGDPSMVLCEAFTGQPFTISVKQIDDRTLQIRAALSNLQLKSTYSDTYHADLSKDKTLFNDRAMVAAPLPEGWGAVKGIKVEKMSSGSKELVHRPVGYALEKDGEKSILHVQVDVPSSGYMSSEFRQAGAEAVINVTRDLPSPRPPSSKRE
ncbi:MAG: hypothetical protein RDV48_12755 [Candidatus Eremiobacteraeota bacterium]|nr:hypothetical protein [Candidatus Eremiobacteraeota bacterium]